MKVSARVFTLLGLMALALFVAMPHQQAVANDAQIDRIVRSGNTIVNLDTMEVTFLVPMRLRPLLRQPKYYRTLVLKRASWLPGTQPITSGP